MKTLKCSTCGKKAVYFRANEGRYYCKQCFITNIEKKVRRTVGNYELIKSGDKVACALSGGKDSSNNLFILNEIFKKNPKVEIFAIAIDEGIRAYRNKSLKNAKKFCDELDVDLHVFSFKEEFGFTLDELTKKVKENYCMYCGVFRRYLLNKYARKLGATKLATGHNLDDEAQSIIMNMLKGDLVRLARVGPMPFLLMHERFVPRTKPLLFIPERESALYSMLKGIPAFFGECPYAYTNTLRFETREFLNKLEEKSPGIKYSLVEGCYRIVSMLKKKLVIGKIKTCKKCGEPSSQDTCKACQLLEKLS